jgi:predicted Rdx family selenoprotein
MSSLTVLDQFAQELLSTFSNSLGEVALQPSTGGVFLVKLYQAVPSSDGQSSIVQEYVVWDRKAEGGFPGMYY